MDWKSLIQDLLDSGMTQTAIGDQIFLSQSCVNDLLKGRTKDIRWRSGDALMRLHMRVMKKAA